MASYDSTQKSRNLKTMAAGDETSSSFAISTNSHDTVLCIIPPNNDPTQNACVKHIRATSALSDSMGLKTVLSAHRMFPTNEEVQQRQKAFALLKQIVLGTSGDDDQPTSDIPMVIVPVGSYALDVWTSESDIDCLCIGTISSKTFFKLARQRLVKADDQGLRILRKVEASTGTMLELSINGVAMGLQYCPATRVVEQ